MSDSYRIFAPMKQRIHGLLEEMSAGLYDKQTECALVLLTAIAGESILLLGPPGIGKSLIARRVKAVFKNAKSFEYLMSRFSTPDEIFGPVSIRKMKEEDRYERNIDGYMPTADVVFLDEIWKAGPAIQNSLLTAINEKIYHNGEKDIRLPMKVLIGASNELPASGEGLEALWDRFIIRMVCGSISKREDFDKMILDEHTDLNPSIKCTITEKEYHQWQSEISKVKVTNEILDIIHSIREAMKTVTIQNEEEYDDEDSEDESRLVYVSDRRWKKIIRLLRTSALMQGRDTINLSDLLLMKYCLWQEMDEIKPINKIIIRSVFSKSTFGILKLRKEIKSYLRKKTEQQTYSKMISSKTDSGKMVYNSFYYHVLAHGIGQTFIAIADFMNIPYKNPAKRSLGEHGIIYQDKEDDEQKTIIRLYDIKNRQGSLPEGWRMTNLLRDNDYIYLDGVKYEIEKMEDGQMQKTNTPLSASPNDFYKEVESICEHIKDIHNRLSSNLFYSLDDERDICEFIEKMNKEIIDIRVNISKAFTYGE